MAPRSVLFVCTRNAIRSPMAAALARHVLGEGIKIESAGLAHGEPDPFAAEVMSGIGIEMTAHTPRTFEELGEKSFDVVVSLSPEARTCAALLAEDGREAEYWPTTDPSIFEGSRTQRLEAYRAVRDALLARVKDRFRA